MSYITTHSDDWFFGAFSSMSNNEFATELCALNDSLDLYLSGDDVLANSFVREYLDEVFDIAKDALVAKFIQSQGINTSMDKVKILQKEINHRTYVENEAVRLISQCRFQEAMTLLETI